MGFISILNNKGRMNEEEIIPGFIYDLNLDQVIERIQAVSQMNVKKLFRYLPADQSCEEYRRAIYADVKKEEVCQLLDAFVKQMEARQRTIARKEKLDTGLQKEAWLLKEAATYFNAITDLYEGLMKVELTSEGMLLLRELLQNYTESEQYQTMQQKACKLWQTLQGFQIRLVYEQGCIVVEEAKVSGVYEDFLRDTLGEYTNEVRSPFAYTEELVSLEKELILRLIKKQPVFFKEMRAFYDGNKDYANKTLIQFAEEVQYYLAYYHFQKDMELRGFSFVAPIVDESKDMRANGLYDLALACDSIKSGKVVVANDMRYDEGESFLVVTGPNQGGKTTFARSLGQLIFLAKMGLDVPATAANVHRFSGILTHFSVEESVETGRGKLMEELVRLKPMMCEDYRNAFVIINELFTTAANYDACIMGTKVLKHFVEQGCRGIYVTHLKELTQAHESVVSMRAMMDENNRQNFKICRHEADDTVCAMNQVNKHRLTYEQLKERLA